MIEHRENGGLDTHDFGIVDFKCVKLIVDKRSLSFQVELVRRPTLDLADGLHLAAYVCMTIKSQGHLLCVTRFQLPIQWQDVKYLSSRTSPLCYILFIY